MSKILLIGNDFGLLSSRSSLLAKTEAEVTCCYTNKVSTLLESNVKIDLVVLCHSVHGRVREVIIETIRAKCPQARILQVTTDLYESSS
ncbi:MAG: hypothetical protein M3O31_08320, partial [Acidobacteriota bacterium]|nr:hypothetical protein [Acidobacteriota bacterium]